MNSIMLKLSKYAFLSSHKVGNGIINLVLSGRTGRNIAITQVAFDCLKNDEVFNIKPEILQKLVDEEVLVDIDEDEFLVVNRKNEELLNEKKSYSNLYVSIQTSAYCQLNCDYCGQEHVKLNMNNEVIDNIINRIESKLIGKFNSLTVSWFGGEPLYGIKQMRIINSRLKEITSKNNIEYIGKITTNGLNLTPKLYRELVTTFNMKGIEITIDGVSEYHDKRRTTKVGKPTFNAIFNNLVGIINSEDSIYDRDKSFISIRCNIDQRNFDGVVPLLDLLSKNGLHNKIFFYTANVFSWAQNGADKGFTIEEYANKCIDYLIYLEQRGFTLINLLPNRTPPVYCLATSENAEMYDAYGNIFDCSETSYSSIYERIRNSY